MTLLNVKLIRPNRNLFDLFWMTRRDLIFPIKPSKITTVDTYEWNTYIIIHRVSSLLKLGLG